MWKISNNNYYYIIYYAWITNSPVAIVLGDQASDHELLNNVMRKAFKLLFSFASALSIEKKIFMWKAYIKILFGIKRSSYKNK